jgi:farnesyl diphosphate synthase
LVVPFTAEASLGQPLTAEQVNELCILGWLVQFQTSYILICDDIVDNSDTRRGQPTWWRRPEIGYTAVSDAFIINFCIYYLLRKYFEKHPAYMDLVHQFQDNSFLTEIGQSADHLIVRLKTQNI